MLRIGSQIRAARESRGYKQKEFAALVFVHPVTMSNYERDAQPTPLTVLEKVANVTGKPLAWFFLEDGWDLVGPSTSRADLEPLKRVVDAAAQLHSEIQSVYQSFANQE